MTADIPDGFFLCFGPPKSGTTFLQRMLNLHPEVSCPSEHELIGLSTALDQVFDDYSQTLRIIDRRTGGQGAALPGRHTRLTVLRTAILTLSQEASHGKPIHGLNDNSLFFSVEFAARLLDQPKMIAIVRNPVDLAISTWHHNQRLAREEPEHASHHLSALGHPGGALEEFVMARTDWYNAAVTRFLEAAAGLPNLVLVRYEDLLFNKRSELRRLFEFLGADSRDATLEPIVAGSTPAAMAEQSANPDFFGVGRRPPSVSGAVRASALRRCGCVLERLGYDLAEIALEP